ncbi:MAG TPA: hypothetical protein VLJ15_04770 [Gammaproteobacteria bacterium]|nr:hypothetical protein [Gammaproteobacteria bacterium]
MFKLFGNKAAKAVLVVAPVVAPAAVVEFMNGKTTKKEDKNNPVNMLIEVAKKEKQDPKYRR